MIRFIITAIFVCATYAPGSHYDSHNRYIGRQNKAGGCYDNRGRYIGRVTPDGRRYDARGRYQGKVKR